jgi:hypothetical protein
MSITTSNLYSESYSVWEIFLKAIPNLDPKKRYRINLIHSSMPNINDKGFNGYPFIVLSIGVGEAKPSFDMRISEKTFRILISIWSPESTDIDGMSDKIINGLRTEGNLPEFQVLSLDNSNFSWDLDKNGKKILFRNINIVAKNRI